MNKIFKSRYFQIIKLFVIKIISLLLKFLSLLYLSSQVLDPDQFGMFSLFLVVLNIAYLFIGFGIIDSGMYLISKDENKSIDGAILVLTIIITILYVLLLKVILFSYGFQHSWLLSILSGGYIFHLYVKKISVGMHDKFSMYYFEFFVHLFSFLLIFLFANNLYNSLFLYSLGMLIISTIFVVKLRPTFSNLGKNIKILIRTIKSYGTRVHVSQFIAMGSYDLDKIMLERIHGFASVGIYNLALNFSNPIKIFSMSISEMMFRDFTKQVKIRKEVFLFNASVSIFFSVGLAIVGYIILLNFYDDSYHEILKYMYLLPVLSLLSSFYVPINNFFSAKGLAKQKFKNAIALAISNIIFNALLIPFYGVFGAIVATILALVVNNLMFIYQYLRYIK